MTVHALGSFRAAHSALLAALFVVGFSSEQVRALGPGCCGTGGSCTVGHIGTTCCDDVACCQEVCALDSYCCEVEWDGFCAGEANAVCDCEPADAPANDHCTSAAAIGLGLTPISNLCATADPPAHPSCTDDQLLNLGLDIWYKYTASFTGLLSVSTCDMLQFTWDSQIAVYNGCNCGALSNPPLGCNNDVDDCNNGSSFVSVPVTIGNCYLIRIGSSYYGPSGTGTVELTSSVPACSVNPPGNAIAETETCGASTNGGCQNLPGTPTFTAASCNTVIKGTGWNNETTRDFDWYQLSIVQQTPVTVTLQSEFPAQFGFAQTNPVGSPSCANWTGAITPSQSAVGGCLVSSLTTTLAPGNWWLRISPTGLDDVPCGGPAIGNDYVLTISCTASCPANLNGDTMVNASDLAVLLGAWGPDPLPLHPANLNMDGFVNAADLAQLLGAWGPCSGTGGACCNADGAGTCLQLTQSACSATGGLFLGNNSSCNNCPPSSCTTSTQNCCTFHNSPGCATLDCCESVCAAQPFCCNNIWDNSCVQLAQQLCEECFNPPANDNCANAIVIPAGDTEFSTVGATTDGVPHVGCQFDDQTYRDIWYNHTATCGGFLKVSTCNQAAYDSDLVIYSGCNCATMSFQECNDDNSACTLVPFTSEVVIPAVLNQCYKVRVGGFQQGNSGTGTLTVECICQNNGQCPPPQICTGGHCVNP